MSAACLPPPYSHPKTYIPSRADTEGHGSDPGTVGGDEKRLMSPQAPFPEGTAPPATQPF